MNIFSPFNMDTFGCTRKCRIIQMLYFPQYDILAANVILSRHFKKLDYFNVEGHLVYTIYIEYDIIYIFEEICSQCHTIRS